MYRYVCILKLNGEIGGNKPVSNEVIDLNEYFRKFVQLFKKKKKKKQINIAPEFRTPWGILNYDYNDPDIIQLFDKLNPTKSYFIGGTKHDTFDRLIVDPHLIHYVRTIKYTEKEHYSHMGDIVKNGLKVQLYKFYEVERMMNDE